MKKKKKKFKRELFSRSGGKRGGAANCFTGAEDAVVRCSYIILNSYNIDERHTKIMTIIIGESRTSLKLLGFINDHN